MTRSGTVRWRLSTRQFNDVETSGLDGLEAYATGNNVSPGQAQLSADAVFRLPLLGKSNFDPYTDSSDVVTCFLRPPRMCNAELGEKSKIKERVANFSRDSVASGDAPPPSLYREEGEMSVTPEGFATSPPGVSSLCAYSRRSYAESCSPNRYFQF